MLDFLNKNTAIFSAISTLINLSLLGFMLKLLGEARAIQKDRIQSAQDKNEVMEERLKLAEDEKKKLGNLNDKLKSISQVLGISSSATGKDSLTGVSVGGNIGNNFQGSIAGRDLNKIDTLIDNSKKLMEGIGELKFIDDKEYEYLVTHPYSSVRKPANRKRTGNVIRNFEPNELYLNNIADEITKQSLEGWEFWELSRGHNYGLEDAVLIFRRPRDFK